ncbi:MAG: FolC bifunctional protein [Clostridia bacterium]|jgi:dihydrofolate synthase/folylpolyglutamate synthase|nr:FolC bifunctional protein [Clostridia bacterium]
MNFNQTVHYIENSMRFGCRPGLARTANLLELLGNPHKNIKCIHIAGTNGKGSTLAMISNIMKHSGYQVGTYTSPHLYKITERMVINGNQISEEHFVKYANMVIDKMKTMEEQNMEVPTQFEMLTAMAFLYFEEMKVDAAVIEVGLGGMYDATNVIEAMLSVITSISYDHMDILGDTIEQIAAEKAGIIKKGATVVLYPQIYKEVEQVVEQVCIEKSAKLIKVSPAQANPLEFDIMGQSFDFAYGDKKIENLQVPLLGDHQIKNSTVAITAAIELSKLGFDISDESIRAGLATVEWPCRLSVISKEPLIIIDGAHNEDGVNSLKDAINKYLTNKKIILVLGMLGDKNYSYAVQELAPLAKRIIATEPISPRALKAEDMADMVKKYNQEVEAEADIVTAIEKAKKSAGQEDVIIICGSLYLAGSAYEYLST